ncbi:MAG: radical SAM protein [Kiritimatiellae bacterium]|nr:radical SAM protein [Kiritimatiellia bacterium]
MKITLVNPKASPKMPYDGPPLSILAAASMLDRTLHDITLLDWHYKNFKQRIHDACRNSAICGITCMTGYQIGTMLEAARIAKQANPEILVVCGGCHPTLMPEQTLASPLVDMAVLGQGPETFRELIETLAGGHDPAVVKGIGFKQNGNIVLTEPRARQDINRFPQPPYDLLENFENYLVKTSFSERTLYYLSSEGCTGNCRFCGEESLYHRRWQALTTDRVVADIARLKARYNFDGVAIADSNFYVNEKRVAELCRRMIPLKLKWGGTSGRPDQLRKYKDETFALMKQSGLQDIFLGVESASDDTLKLMSKGCLVADTLQVLPRLYAHGIRVQCSFIIGVPGVNIKNDFSETMRFINRLRKTGYVSQFHLFVYTPLPGTRFLDEALRLGYRMPRSLEDWTNYEFHAQNVVPWVPQKYAAFTDAASIYFMFLAGHAGKVIDAVVPKPLRIPAKIAERLMRLISDFRISTACFALPIEYHLIKYVLMNKERFFDDRKLMF